ncbi:MAG: 5-(carboxyamino)imidazole ribonucleotide synthase [Elusimicrobia bacterium]|nr:5-(carboxyamino)imidazole ribonucleotide synthase [Elusimicrobiota bacterium]
MEKILSADLKLGIIAGGQLGKMLIQEASKWDIITYVLDDAENCPCAGLANVFVKGSRFDFDAVYNFGKKVDILTFEIESINVEALFKLKEEGLKIVPDPSILQLFQNKEKQKEFYVKNNLPTSPFTSYKDKDEVLQAVEKKSLRLPFVQKLKTGGYDGRGVSVINTEADLKDLLEGECIVEEKVDIHKEIAVIVARNESGEVKTFPAVDMVFDPKANLVKHLVCPVLDITEAQHKLAEEIARKLITDLNMCGLLAIEFFIDAKGNILVNESAPRTHNSGHHTIEGIVTSQFEQQLRAVLNLPLGSTQIKMPAVMVNLLGEPGFEGKVKYEGFAEALAIEGVNIHLYGKKTMKPFRKMGHITIIDKELDNAVKKSEIVKNTLKVKA